MITLTDEEYYTILGNNILDTQNTTKTIGILYGKIAV